MNKICRGVIGFDGDCNITINVSQPETNTIMVQVGDECEEYLRLRLNVFHSKQLRKKLKKAEAKITGAR